MLSCIRCDRLGRRMTRSHGRARWFAFAAVTFGYLSVTSGEALLSPAFPILAERLDLDIGTAGLAGGVLNVSIAIGAILGGFVFSRFGSQKGAILGVLLSAAGGVLTAASANLTVLLVGQGIGGFGSGMFFASGLSAVGVLAGSRRGLAIGLFSIAFTGGVALAPMMIAIAGDAWRAPFVIAACLSLIAAAGLFIWRIPAAAHKEDREAMRPSLLVMLTPLAVGVVAAIAQYATVFFMPIFVVTTWHLSPASAAFLLVIARILSFPAKLLAGSSTDRGGAVTIAKRHAAVVTVLGLWWTLVPGPAAASWAVVLYIAITSTLGPLGNVLAFDAFGQQGKMLGAFRAIQIAAGAVAAAAIGLAADRFGLQETMTVAAVLPVTLLLLRSGSRQSDLIPALSQERPS